MYIYIYMCVYTQYIICIWDYSRLTLGKEIGHRHRARASKGLAFINPCEDPSTEHRKNHGDLKTKLGDQSY